MAKEAFPSWFVDRKTGYIKRIEAPLEKLAGDILPQAGRFGIFGLKAMVLASAIGGPWTGVVLGLAAAAGKMVMKGGNSAVSAMRSLPLPYFDPWHQDMPFNGGYAEMLKQKQPQLLDDIAGLSASLGLKGRVEAMVMTRDYAGKDKALSGETWTVSVLPPPYKGGKYLMMIGEDAIDSLTPRQMRMVTGHELTHAKKKHMQSELKSRALIVAELIVSAALLVKGAVFGPLLVLPTVGALAAAEVAGKSLQIIRARHHEMVADRGAMLAAGANREDMAAGIGALEAGVKAAFLQETERSARARGVAPPAWKEPGPVLKFFLEDHPALSLREKAAEAFERKYPGYIKERRQDFAPPPPARRGWPHHGR